MTLEHLPTITSLPVAEIKVGSRIRPVSEAGVGALDLVIAEYGFTVPILVRKTRTGFHLIDGAHRLETMKRRRAETIPVVVLTCLDDEAAALEGSQNLAGAAMSPLDDAIFLAAFGDAYQRLHPETKRGAAGALAKHGYAMELNSFAEVIGEKRSITPRQVRKIAAAGRLISREEADRLRSAPRKITLKDVETIGRIGDPDERAAVILRLSVGNAKSAAEARRTLAAENAGVQTPVKDPVDAAFKALAALWGRAPKAAKWRFLEEFGNELGVMLADLEEAEVARMIAEAEAK